MTPARSLTCTALAAALAVSACGPASHPAPPPAPTAAPVPAAGAIDPATDPAVRPVAFLLGAWQAASGTTETWSPAGDALFGVGFGGDGFECIILGVQDGALTYRAMPGGQPAVDFRVAELTADTVRFTNPDHDFPQAITYRRAGDELVATIAKLDGSGAVELRYRRVEAVPAPALAEADLAFARDTAAGGAAGWASWFDPAGAMLRPTGRIEGRPAIEAAMTSLFSDPAKRLDWRPAASGLAPSGILGFTVGNAELLVDGVASWRGAYVTIWRRQADGGWRVLFDTGDDA